MATPTTVDLDTELSAVNSILGSIGQSPVTNLDHDNPETSFIFNILRETNVDVQSEGWVYNLELNYEFAKDTNGYINIPSNILRLDRTDDHKNRTMNLVRRNGRLYDKVKHTDVFTENQHLDVTWLFPFEELPVPFRRYIVYKAAGRAAQLVGNPDLVRLLALQETRHGLFVLNTTVTRLSILCLVSQTNPFTLLTHRSTHLDANGRTITTCT